MYGPPVLIWRNIPFSLFSNFIQNGAKRVNEQKQYVWESLPFIPFQ